MEVSVDSLREHIPYYLTQDQKEGLKRALEDFSRKGESASYYTTHHQGELLQGDGWGALEIIQFKDTRRISTKGILLSNTCDMDPGNKRERPPNIVFAPIISLSRYRELLVSRGLPADVVSSKIGSIKRQEVTSIFYLPRGGGLFDEYIAYFDDIHTIPIAYFDCLDYEQNLFTLSQFGFYLFLFKISVHFCRFHENVTRDSV